MELRYEFEAAISCEGLLLFRRVNTVPDPREPGSGVCWAPLSLFNLLSGQKTLLFIFLFSPLWVRVAVHSWHQGVQRYMRR